MEARTPQRYPGSGRPVTNISPAVSAARILLDNLEVPNIVLVRHSNNIRSKLAKERPLEAANDPTW
jgi:hypothetical protein